MFRLLKQAHAGQLEGKDGVHQLCQEGTCTGDGSVGDQ